MPTTPCKNPKLVVMDAYLGSERWKHPYLWRENVDVMTSQCPQKTRKGICEYPASFYSSLANQILCNKQSALEFSF